MTLFDYEHMSVEDKTQWLDSFQITAGLKYFGGKTFIGRYLANHILNMAVQMKRDGHKADIFIDAFAGGGKIALSMPAGWFDTIVLNDINYGVYSFFKCCKEEPRELIKMIEELGSIMSEDYFNFFIENRSKQGVKPLESAAMTFWVTQTAFNGQIARRPKYSIALDPSFTRAKEREEIERIIKYAKKHIKRVHDRMVLLNIEVENLDYRELIKKYNGKPYWNTGILEDGALDKYKEKNKSEEVRPWDYEELEEIYRKCLTKETDAIEEYQMQNKLWYFDPPYHRATLYGGLDAPYEDTFNRSDSIDMVEILHGDYANIFGEIPYFIKSDYSPRNILRQVREQLAEAKASNTTQEQARDEKIKEYQARINQLEPCEDDFNCLEDNVTWSGHTAIENPQFYRVFVGEFDKGVVDEDKGTRKKGREYIWCRGNYIKGMVSD